MDKIRFGIVGLGNQGTTYLFSFFDKDKVYNSCITALCDINEEKIKFTKEKTSSKNITYFTDYKEMLDSGLCDVVLVETPHYIHPEIVMECLKRNINVICEKPAGVYVDQVIEMNEAAKKSKAKFAMMFNQRTNCVYRKMREIIQNGGIGELQRVNWIITDWFRTQSYYDMGSWRATWSGEGGGVLINQCPHQIDLVQWIVGEMPDKVRGFCEYGKWHDIEVEDEVTAFFKYKNGATGIFITTTGETPGTNRLEISGTKGKLLSEGNSLKYYKNSEDSAEFSKHTKKLFASPEFTVEDVVTDGENLQHLGIINNFVKSILGEEELFVEGVEGIHGVELMNAIELSGWNNGEEISIPIDKDRYTKELKLHCKNSKIHKKDNNVIYDTSATYEGVKK